jgi:hypothetical protein
MAAMESYSVPIKLGDEDEEMPTAMHHLDLVGESKHQHHRQDDAFSRYSNNFLRLKSLLLLSKDVDQEEEEDDDDDDLDALAKINQALSSVGLSNLTHLTRDKRRRGNDSRRIIQQGNNVRKTRLSWELHPDLLSHDITLEPEALYNGTHRILSDEEEEEAAKKKPQRSQVQEAPREEKE